MLPACYFMFSKRSGLEDNINKHLLLFFLLMQALVMFFTCYFLHYFSLWTKNVLDVSCT